MSSFPSVLIGHLENTEEINTKRLKIGYRITEHIQTSPLSFILSLKERHEQKKQSIQTGGTAGHRNLRE